MSNIACKKNILVIGSGGVGKTSYIMKKVGLKTTSKYIPTIGIHSYEKDNTVWYDFPGQEAYGCHTHYMTEKGYKYMDVKMDLVIYMYDVTNKLSKKSLNHWKKYVKRVFFKGNETFESIVIGNKTARL